MSLATPTTSGNPHTTSVDTTAHRSPLAKRPYGLGHACLSTWLNAGVSAQRVAGWAGNSVEVLLRTYAKCLVGQDERSMRLISEVLRPTPAGKHWEESAGRARWQPDTAGRQPLIETRKSPGHHGDDLGFSVARPGGLEPPTF
ncbi:hypothetical protein Sme01_54250 [Sphaerisporangium melleum]|uniref:Integrase n=1 Tax=Sphaerisporangium melleum TaxID=321316 RepID=A0A917R5V6_9ACTN|nr:hypothetical protein GCM10007964_38110 [Sphaerisporangium melleum]GII72949.1 hypothetical protein Sme01_54250 [Sphaerisporangium melleum]